MVHSCTMQINELYIKSDQIKLFLMNPLQFYLNIAEQLKQ